jgi:CheY-like chemotaxis protein
MELELKRILLAEDDPNDIELTLAGLAETNLANEVIVVRDGIEALDYLNSSGKFENRPTGNPAIVLLDIKMPRLDGLEVLKQMKSNEKFKKIPVVLLTSSRDDKDLLKGYEFGCNAYVVKPVQFQDFVSAIKELGIFWAVINEPPPGSLGKT